jgi:hypothetical protein
MQEETLSGPDSHETGQGPYGQRREQVEVDDGFAVVAELLITPAVNLAGDRLPVQAVLPLRASFGIT